MTTFRDTRQDARLEALEHRVTAILQHLGIEDPVPATPAGVSPRVAELARAGKTMQAVKAHVDDTGADLRAARDAVAAISQTD